MARDDRNRWRDEEDRPAPKAIDPTEPIHDLGGRVPGGPPLRPDTTTTPADLARWYLEEATEAYSPDPSRPEPPEDPGPADMELSIREGGPEMFAEEDEVELEELEIPRRRRIRTSEAQMKDPVQALEEIGSAVVAPRRGVSRAAIYSGVVAAGVLGWFMFRWFRAR